MTNILSRNTFIFEPNPNSSRSSSKLRITFILKTSQQAISKIEQSADIEENTLERIAVALGVSPDAIKNYSDEAVIYNIQNNYEGSNNHGANIGHQFNFNPIEKLVELFEENKKLYERLLASEKEKIELLKKKYRDIISSSIVKIQNNLPIVKSA